MISGLCDLRGSGQFLTEKIFKEGSYDCSGIAERYVFVSQFLKDIPCQSEGWSSLSVFSNFYDRMQGIEFSKYKN